MKPIRSFGAGLALILTATTVLLSQSGGWRDSFRVDKAALMDSGRGEYFVLEPGYRLRFAHGKDTLAITVLKETKVVDGVNTRVVEERELSGDRLLEVSRNYFAIDKVTNDAYYFGEDVDIYKDGKLASHDGSWLSGVNGAKFGLAMPGQPKVGDKYYQEMAPKVAMDRAEIVSVTEALKLPAGAFSKCVHTRESSAIEHGSEGKWYAPGVGLVKDSEFVLVGIDKP